MIVNRIGDCGLLLGILCIFVTFYSLEYTVVFSLVYKVMDYKLLFLDLELNVIMLICLLLFIGIIGKSAQLGLHT
jgi:NADH-quinone oxidoreductase subunit L